MADSSQTRTLDVLLDDIRDAANEGDSMYLCDNDVQILNAELNRLRRQSAAVNVSQALGDVGVGTTIIGYTAR